MGIDLNECGKSLDLPPVTAIKLNLDWSILRAIKISSNRFMSIDSLDGIEWKVYSLYRYWLSQNLYQYSYLIVGINFFISFH
jgi:hypothetical protein